MNRIRPFRPEDTEGVASLYEDVRWDGRRGAHAGLVRWLQDALDHPWSDEEIPSLVATDSRGEVVGFLASHVRRLVADGRPVRLAGSGHLVVAEQARRLGTGAMLTATYLRGPQDLSITDGATEEVALIWEGLGGDTAPLQQLSWIRPVAPWKHPLRLARAVASRAAQRPLGPVDPSALPPLSSALDGGVQVAPLTPRTLVAALPEVTARLRLHPAYDVPFATWLLAQLARSAEGALRAACVQSAEGRALGYYAYFARPGGPSPVACLAAPTVATSATVLEAMLADARDCGVAALVGRVEPRLAPALPRNRVVLQVRGTKALVHSRDPELMYLATSRHALLTRLEGEWCLMPPSPSPEGRAADPAIPAAVPSGERRHRGRIPARHGT